MKKSAAAEQRLLHEAFLWSVDDDEHAEALRIGAESISYGRLHERALRLAGDLVADRKSVV